VWAKLLGNMCFNPVSLLTGSSTDRLIDDPRVHALFVAMMEEAIALGRKLGIDAGIEPRPRIANTRKIGYVKTSMLQDAEAGRPVEIEGILGTVVEVAHAAGFPAPLADAVFAMSRMRAEVMSLLPNLPPPA
jgi:2-dehydropantoate 2-reductase